MQLCTTSPGHESLFQSHRYSSMLRSIDYNADRGNCPGTKSFEQTRPLSDDLSAIRAILHESLSKQQFQRALCVWLKSCFSMTSQQIALAIGWTPASVRKVQWRFAREGIQTLLVKPKGGRKRELISFGREQQILDKFLRQTRRGGSLDVDQIRMAYELSVGKTVARSTIYRLIHRHGLRRFLPRARSSS